MSLEKHTITCPQCGLEIQTRARLGYGTQKGKGMKVNLNRANILTVLSVNGKPMSVRDVQSKLVKNNIQRVSKRNTGWNYHSVQADLSILVGMKKIEMLKPHQIEHWDSEDGHTTKGIPLYKAIRGVENGTIGTE